MSQLYIGLMSGTSADAIDAALVDLNSSPRLIAHHSLVFDNNLRQRIHLLAQPGNDEIDRLGALDVHLGQLFAQACIELLNIAGLDAKQITAIGSHGQTIRHRPPGTTETCFSLQIGDPNTIVQVTGITTVADFRRRDMAASGHGAPLVPAFHKAIFQSSTQDRVILNIGGMANITWLPKQGPTLGFDTGPGNVLMDGWIQLHKGLGYDQGGHWATQGKVDEVLLQRLLAEPYFSLVAPKSTGRESFNLAWLEQCIEGLNLAPEDIQASLLELSARSISDQIDPLGALPKEIYICGGGAYNKRLMERLQQLLPRDRLNTTAALGIDPQWVEAMAFAWLAQQTINRKPGNLCAVTGASQEVILGGIYYA